MISKPFFKLTYRALSQHEADQVFVPVYCFICLKTRRCLQTKERRWKEARSVLATRKEGRYHEAMLFASEVAPIRKQIKSEGYVHLRNFISRQRLDATLKKATQIAFDMGFLLSPNSPARLRKNRLAISYDDHIVFAAQLKRTQEYQDLLSDLQMCMNLDLILGNWEYYCPEVNDTGVWARFVGPSRKNPPLPPHQDASYHGSEKTIFGFWFPLEDCPGKLGALALQPHSHLGGCQRHNEQGFLPLKVDQTWYRPSLKKGDCLIFSNMCVHGPQKNQYENRPRFSVDCRILVSGDSIPTLRPRGQR